MLVNDEGETAGTLLELLQRCQTPFGECAVCSLVETKPPSGKRLFRFWITSPLRDVAAINDR